MRKKEYPQITKEFLYEKYWKEKLPVSKIAKIIGCSGSVINNRMKFYKIKKRSLSEAGKEKNKLYPQLYDKKWLYQKYWIESLSGAKIAELTGCTSQCVYQHMRSFGMKRRACNERREPGKYQQRLTKGFLYQKYHKEALSIYQIAKVVGCNHTTVIRYMIHFDIKRRGRNDKRASKYFQLEDKAWLYEKYCDEKLSTFDIARILGCSDGAVRNHMTYFGMERRNRGASNIGKVFSKEHKKKISNAIINARRRGVYGIHPNNFETKIFNLLNQLSSYPWQYVGSGKKVTGFTVNKNPDFIPEKLGNRKAIEANGIYWHFKRHPELSTKQEIEEKESVPYKLAGYNVLFLWDDEDLEIQVRKLDNFLIGDKSE